MEQNRPPELLRKRSSFPLFWRQSTSLLPVDDTVSQNDLTGPLFNLACNVLGAGVLALPYTLMVCGPALGIIFLVCSAILADFSLNMLLDLTDWTQCRTYEALAERILGPAFGSAISFFTVALNFGGTCSLFVILGDLGGQSLVTLGVPSDSFYSSRQFIVGFCAAFIVFPLCIPKKMNSLRFASTASVFLIFAICLCVSAACGVLMFEGEAHGAKTDTVASHNATSTHHGSSKKGSGSGGGGEGPVSFLQSARSMFAVLPILLLSFCTHVSFIPIYTEFREKHARAVLRAHGREGSLPPAIVDSLAAAPPAFYMDIGSPSRSRAVGKDVRRSGSLGGSGLGTHSAPTSTTDGCSSAGGGMFSSLTPDVVAAAAPPSVLVTLALGAKKDKQDSCVALNLTEGTDVCNLGSREPSPSSGTMDLPGGVKHLVSSSRSASFDRSVVNKDGPYTRHRNSSSVSVSNLDGETSASLRQSFSTIVSGAIYGCCGLYLLVAVMGHLAFGGEIHPDILTNFDTWQWFAVIKLCYCVSIVAAFPILVVICRRSLESLLFGGSLGFVPRIILTAALLAMAATVGMFVDRLDQAFGLTGATTGYVLCYIAPSLLFVKTVKRAETSPSSRLQLSESRDNSAGDYQSLVVHDTSASTQSIPPLNDAPVVSTFAMVRVWVLLVCAVFATGASTASLLYELIN